MLRALSYLQMMNWRAAIGFILCSSLGPVLAATDPAADGPFPSTLLTLGIPGTQGATLTTDVYFPGTNNAVSPAAGRCPIIVLGHGFSQSKDQHVNQGRHLATRGYIVLIPNSNAASDHSRFADDLRKCIDWIEARDADTKSFFFGCVRADRVGATGHSAGGLSAILAASRDPRIRAVSPMDPVDNGGLGVTALASVAAPVAIAYSEPSSCNADGSALTLYNAALAPKRGIRIVGANHTDPQDPASALSALFCGPANSTRQALYRRYMAGWFEYHLRGDASYGPWVFNQAGGPLASELASNKITYAEAPSPLAAWRYVNFGTNVGNAAVAGDAADPEGDRLSNLEEYAFNTDPLAGNAAPIVSASLVATNGAQFLAMTFPLVTAASDITYRVEASADLQTWLPGCTYSGTIRVTATVQTTEFSRAGAGLETLVVRDNVPIPSAPHRFLRLRVTQP
jgi:dienelactone hydrolase